MEYKKLMAAAAMIGAVSFGASTASAKQSAYDVFTGKYGATQACYVCHNGEPGVLTAYGQAYVAAGGSKTGNINAINTIDAQYGAQIAAGSLPDTKATSSGGGGGGGCVTSSITTPLTMALALLTLGFFVRRKKD